MSAWTCRSTDGKAVQKTSRHSWDATAASVAASRFTRPNSSFLSARWSQHYRHQSNGSASFFAGDKKDNFLQTLGYV